MSVSIKKICHNQYFSGKGFRFQLSVCDSCQNVFMISIDIEKITILSIFEINFCCFISSVSKSEAIVEKSALLSWFHVYYVHQASVSFNYFSCRGSLKTTYITLLAWLLEHSLVHWCKQCVTLHQVLKCIRKRMLSIYLSIYLSIWYSSLKDSFK